MNVSLHYLIYMKMTDPGTTVSAFTCFRGVATLQKSLVRKEIMKMISMKLDSKNAKMQEESVPYHYCRNNF